MGLLDEVKNYLDITWEDPATDAKISGLIDSGKAYLDLKAGASLVYEGEGCDPHAAMLLKDYARYARSGALDEFEGNYSHEIGSLQEKYEAGRLPGVQ